MSFRFSTAARLLVSLVLASSRLWSQDTTLAGWTFSQFLGEGAPGISAETFETTDRIVATYRGALVPDSNLVDGAIVGVNGGPGYTDPSIGVWDFAGFDINDAVSVRADTFGALNTQNSTTLDGVEMFRSDAQGMMLTFNTVGTPWSITVAGTTGYVNASAADFTYAARGNGGAAVVEWLFNGAVFATQTISPGPAFLTYAHELPPGFYGNGVIQGRLASGSVSFDNVQINGRLGVPPQFTTQPADLVRLVGETAVFSVAVTGATAPTYQWFKGDVALDGKTDAVLTLANVQLGDAGAYRVTVRSSNGTTADSAFATLEVRQAPTITRHPAAQVANPGQTLTFSVAAGGFPEPTYRWQRNEVDLVDGPGIDGSASSTLVLSDVTEASEGNYRVVVQNVVSSATSSAASLTVSDVQVAPSITTDPLDAVGIVGGSVEFTVVASGAPAPTYQWFYDDVPLVDGPGISGATTNRLIISDLSMARAGLYTVVVTNSVGTSEREVELVMQAPPQIVSGPGPGSQSAVTGSTVTFQVAATGDPAPAFQWLRNGEPIDGETSDTLVLSSVTSAANGAYSVRVSNPAGTIVSSSSVLFVGTGVLITAQPKAQLVAIGGSVTLAVTASGNPAPDYQWFRDGEPIDGATDRTLTLNDVTAADAATYAVRVSNIFASELSSPALVSVARVVNNATPNVTQVYTPGSTLVIGSTTITTSPLRYEWYLNGKRISGASGPVLSIQSATFADSGTYSVKVYGVNNRLLGSRVVSTIRISVAGTYDALLHDSVSGEAFGLVRVTVAANGAFTGSLYHADGKTYALKGRFTFTEAPYLGRALLVIRRSGGLPSFELDLFLNARTADLDMGLGVAGAEGDLGVASGAVRAKGAVAWKGRYKLALAPKAPVAEGQPTATNNLVAKIGSTGSMSITGTLADKTKITASFPSSPAAGYAVWFKLYSGKGYLGGELDLVETAPGVYAADAETSGDFVWFRPANPKSKVYPGGIDLLLAPTLAKP